MSHQIRDARMTGLLYFGLGITGMLGFLLIRPQLFDPADPAATFANLADREALARFGVALELGIVVIQALTALAFYRLFRSVDALAAGALAVFGMANAFAILGSTAMLATALEVVHGGLGNAAAEAQLLYLVSGNMWRVGGVFFGLWLVPMGWLVLRSRWLPRPLGWLLLAGGAGYVLNTFMTILIPGSEALSGVLVIPATVGEFWMIGYLLVRGVGRNAAQADLAVETAP